MNSLFRICFHLWILVLLPSIGHSQPLQARASVDPPVLSVGQTAAYRIEIPNTNSLPNLNAPRIDGLEFGSQPSTGSQTSITNGVVTTQASLSWTLRATREGRYTIPGQTLTWRGQTLTVPAVTLEVRPAAEVARNRFSLELQLPDTPVYVGQSVPAILRLYVRRGIQFQLETLPELASDRFVHTPLSTRPVQTMAERDGLPFTVVVWEVVLTPIEAGTLQLQFQSPLRYETGRRERDFFFDRPVYETLALQSPALSLQVLPLPPNPPAGFMDAIGTFSAGLKLDSNQLRVGEPLTLELTVRGEGNFERMRAPELADTADWRVYPPRVTFNPGDDYNYSGEKIFSWLMVPQHEAVTTTPEVPIAWLDPARRQYRTEVLPPSPVSVQPAATGGRIVSNRSAEERRISRPTTGLRPIATDPGTPSVASGLQPLWQQPVFWVVQSGFGLGFAALCGLLYLRRQRAGEFHRQRRFATARLRNSHGQLIKAARTRDVAAFCGASQSVIRECSALLDGKRRPPPAYALHDMQPVWQRHVLPADTIDALTRVWNLADLVKFAGAQPSATDLTQHIAAIDRLLDAARKASDSPATTA
jgi:hypothetical protein